MGSPARYILTFLILAAALQGCASLSGRSTRVPARFIDVQIAFVTAPMGSEKMAPFRAAADAKSLPERTLLLLADNGYRVGICPASVQDRLKEMESTNGAVRVTARSVRLLDHSSLRETYFQRNRGTAAGSDLKAATAEILPPTTTGHFRLVLGEAAERIHVVTERGTIDFLNVVPAMDAQAEVRSNGNLSLTFSPIVIGPAGATASSGHDLTSLEFVVELKEGEWVILSGMRIPGTCGAAAFFRDAPAQTAASQSPPSPTERIVLIKASTAEEGLRSRPS